MYLCTYMSNNIPIIITIQYILYIIKSNYENIFLFVPRFFTPFS